jgi:hypothetical protein
MLGAHERARKTQRVNEAKMRKAKAATSGEMVQIYNETAPQLFALQTELRELSKKKPDGTLSKAKVALINRVLADIKQPFQKECGGKYLELLDDETLPQYSDVVLIIAQYATVLTQFRERHTGQKRELRNGVEHRIGAGGHRSCVQLAIRTLGTENGDCGMWEMSDQFNPSRDACPVRPITNDGSPDEAYAAPICQRRSGPV